MNLAAQPAFTAPFHAVVDTAAFGIAAIRAARGLAVADFDDDGDDDVILGREPVAGRYYAAIEQSERLDHNWVGLALGDPNGADRSPIGARVEVRKLLTQQVIGVSQVDGGSGRGSQRQRRLLLGLGPYEGDLEVAVRWPSGRPSVDTVTVLNAYHEIHQPATVAILDSTVTFGFDFDPVTGLMDWRFEWQTDNWTDSAFDVVEIQCIRGHSCGFAEVTLEADDPLVDVALQRADAEIGIYDHTLIWRDQTCYLGCTYRFTVTSKVDETRENVTSGLHQFSFLACPSGN
jgi:hypothetical protein